MKNRIKNITWLLLLAASFASQAKVNIFACEPEWQSLAISLGGKHVKTFSATSAFQDPHHIEARPSLIAKMRRADLLICTGSELEIAWLPLLQRQSGNKTIQDGQPGHFLASEMVSRIEIPSKLDRSLGDIHAGGNPHVHLDPYRLQTIATAFSQRLQTIDPGNQSYYQQQHQQFQAKWSKAITRWEALASSLKNKKAVIYHRNWSYLLNWLGIDTLTDLEPKPGIPPNSSHLVKVLKIVQQQQADFIMLANYQDTKGAKWLADKTTLPVINLPFTVGGNKQATDLFSLYDSIIQQLLEQ